VLDKVSLKDDNDNKLYKGPQFETDSTLSFIAMGAGATGGTKFHFISVDKDINIVKRSALEFPYTCTLTNGREVLIEEDGVSKWYYVAVVTPVQYKGSPSAPSAMTYSLIMLDINESKVVRNIPFTTAKAGFVIENASIIGDEIILCGKTSASTEYPKGYTGYEYDPKTASLQVIRIKGSEVVFNKGYTSQDLTAKINVVPGVKGKTTATAFMSYKNVYIYKDVLFLNTQCYTPAKNVSVALEDVENTLEYESNIIDVLNLEQQQKTLLRMLKTLSSDEQALLKMKFFENLENSAIAAILDKTEGAIRVMQYRAINKLQKLIKNDQN
jgi:RNA polymerase sigma factor (sigma-70 family)